MSCRNETDTSAFVDCKNRKTYGCFRHYISDKQARILKKKTKGCFLLKTEGAFLILVLLFLSKASWLHYFIKTLTCDVVETNVEINQSEMRTQSLPHKRANPGSEKMLISVTSAFLSLWGCNTESPEHILDGTGYIYLSHSPRHCMVKKKRAHYAGKQKASLERIATVPPIFVLQLFV